LRTALICGITGQDGAYLASFLTARRYRVVGTTRRLADADLSRLRHLALDAVEMKELRPGDVRAARQLIDDVEPDELYALWGQSSVGRSFAEPHATFQSLAVATQGLLEAVRLSGRPVRFLHASSSECFGDLGSTPATEATPIQPCSPYGAAKAAAHLLVQSYRASFGVFATNSILFNHESPLRPASFVTRKITRAAYRIAHGSAERLVLGRIDIVRDWGWAPEYVDAMWRSLQQDEARDYVLATGRSYRLTDFVQTAFQHHGLDWRRHVDVDASLFRPSDPLWIGADPSRAARELGWSAQTRMPEVATTMAAAETGAD